MKKIAEEGGQPISTIFLLVVAPIKLVTMVTFISWLTLLFSRTDHPPKIAPVGYWKKWFLGGLHKSISLHLFRQLIQVYTHITQVLCPFKWILEQMFFVNVLYTNKQCIVGDTFRKRKNTLFQMDFSRGSGKIKFKGICNLLTIHKEIIWAEIKLEQGILNFWRFDVSSQFSIFAWLVLCQVTMRFPLPSIHLCRFLLLNYSTVYLELKSLIRCHSVTDFSLNEDSFRAKPNATSRFEHYVTEGKHTVSVELSEIPYLHNHQWRFCI